MFKQTNDSRRKGKQVIKQNMVVVAICGICNEPIFKKDSYVKLIDYKLGEFYKEGFYHNPCYQKQIDEAITRNREKLKAKLMLMFGKGIPEKDI